MIAINNPNCPTEEYPSKRCALSCFVPNKFEPTKVTKPAMAIIVYQFASAITINLFNTKNIAVAEPAEISAAIPGCDAS